MDAELPSASSDTAEVVQRQSAPIVLALGVAPSSIDSLARFIDMMSEPERFAVVVVARQREAFDAGRLAASVRGGTGRLGTIETGGAVEAGQVYLAPADVIVTIEDGTFHLRSSDNPATERGAIDSFFVSLAIAYEENAIGVVFAGTGQDGSLGVTAIREHGGLVIAENEHEDADLLSTSKRAAALADFQLTPEQMPGRILTYARQIAATQDTRRLRAQMPDVAAALTRIAAVLRTATGHDFHGYKPNTFLRRVHRRMQVVGSETLDAYLSVLKSDAEEPQNLFNDLLIGVTQFFRDNKEFELLEQKVIPDLFAGKGADDQVRIWVLGCATGEEAYSIGILLREHMTRLDVVPQIQIFATDIDGRALAAARVGRYADSIAHDVSPARLARWFIKEGNTYRVVKEVREMCLFSGHNIVRDAPFSRLDLISCRNLLIYLNSDLQARIIPLFHFGLRPGGTLFLGNSENVSPHTKLFAPIDRRARIFRRVETATRVVPDFPIGAPRQTRIAGRSPPAERRVAPIETMSRRAEQIAERYAPAYVIVDDQFDILHFSGRTGRFLDPPSGTASLNLLHLVHRDLRLDLRTALEDASSRGAAARADRIAVGQDSSRFVIDLVVEPLQDAPNAPRNFVVVFKDGVVAQQTESAAPGRDEYISRLEEESRLLRERLQSTIEELESTNEELKSSNEEFQSINEELQSANEELETSKEELQSVNEELTTVNGELAQRVHELARTNSDIKNLLESTQIATMFLDNDLRVMNYTPAVADVFHLVETDIGRPISHIKARIALDDLQNDVRRVIRTLASVERTVDDRETGARYVVNVLPYRSVDNFIAGVVVTFINVTAMLRAERALGESEKRFRDLAEFSPDGILIAAEGRLVYANQAVAALLGASPEAIIRGLALTDIVDGEFHRVILDSIARVEGGRDVLRAEVGLMRTDHSLVMTEVSAGPITWDGKPSVQIVVRDIGARKHAEANQKLLLAELQHRVRNTLAVLRSIARRTAESSATMEDYSAHLDGRIEAFSRVQAAVTRDPEGSVDLERMVAEELLAYQAKEGDQVRLSGPAVRLRHKAAETFGLAIHELATNAVKHGALGYPGGRVEIAWQVVGGERPTLHFGWVESGPEDKAAPPTRRGFGTELLQRTLAFELKAETSLDFSAGHLNCRIALPFGDWISLSPSSPSTH